MYRDVKQFENEEVSRMKVLDNIIKHKSEHIRYNKLERYYKGDNDILYTVLTDKDRPNNKIAHPFGTYITDLLTGYFMGEPVSYSYNEDDIDFKELKAVLTYNIEHDENIQLARKASIFGEVYEVIFIDDDGNIKFINVDPDEIFIVHDMSIMSTPLYSVRYLKIDDGYTIEVYTDESIFEFRSNESLSYMKLISRDEHNFGEVPVIKYGNNDYDIGDFEKQIPLIDAYDKFVSDSLNDFDYFTNAYLAFYGVDAPDEDVAEMKQERLLFFPEGAKAEFITKDLHGTQVENHLKRTENDIHKLSKVPNSSDESFANNSSGVAMQYKLLGTENLAISKERRFKKSLQKRIRLIVNFLNFVGKNNIEWREVGITFTRNLPVDISSAVESVNQLRGLLSDETLIGWLPNIEDPKEELIKRDKENNDSEPPQFDFSKDGTVV